MSPSSSSRTLSQQRPAAHRHWPGLLVSLLLAGTVAADRYVVKDNPGACAPYDTWATAADDIQSAVDAACEGPPVWTRSSQAGPFLARRSYRAAIETVWVRAGVYDNGGATSGRWRDTLTNRVAVSKAVIVRSEHDDPRRTIIRGARAIDGRTNGVGAVRCVYLADGASLIGFTLTGGATFSSEQSQAGTADRGAGGLYAQSSMAIVSNCIIAGNAAGGHPRQGWGGGGAHGGTYIQCDIVDNHTPYHAGGAQHVVLFDCRVAGNTAGRDGGGVHGGILYDCVVSNNVAGGSGGGVFRADLYRCRITHNQAGRHGGGAASTDSSPLITLHNCTVAFNHAARAGGGVRMGRLLDCNIFSNTAGVVGADIYQCVHE